MIRIIIVGMSGQMGTNIAKLAMERQNGFSVVAGVDKFPQSNPWNIPVYKSLFEVETEADVVIDFSRPEAVAAVLAYCKLKGFRAVIGTTGLSADERSLIEQYSSSIPVFFTGNMSLGVNLQMELTKRAAATLGEAFEVEIIDKHHHLKVDSPSGTALMLADNISTQFPTDRKYVFGRYTKTERRKPNEIGFHSIRGGTIVGEHEVLFIGQDEIIEVNHRAYSKQVFATGALRAAAYLMDKQPGVYDMHNIVTEKNVLSHLYAVEDQAVITISGVPHVPGVLSAVFSAIGSKSILVDMISHITTHQKTGEISFSIAAKQLDAALAALEELKAKYPDMIVDAITGLTKLTVEGAGMQYYHGVAAQIFEVLADSGINIFLITTSETKIAYCIENSEVHKAIQAMSEKLNL